MSRTDGNSHDHAVQVAVEVRVGRDLSKHASYAGYKGGHVKRKQVSFGGGRKKEREADREGRSKGGSSLVLLLYSSC